MNSKIISSIAIFLICTVYTGYSGSVKAVIADNNTSQPMIGASAALYKIKDSTIVTGNTSNNKGIVQIQNVPNGFYYLKVTYIGYKPQIVNKIAIRQNKPDITLDTIFLLPGDVNADEIEVTADKPLMEYSTDKKVFNVSKSLVSSGGDALDVLKTIPSVDVDIDNNVSLRGSGDVKILINGQESASASKMLETIPADMIEKIEVMTNPSSKYNPEGSSGIINIVMKKNTGGGGFSGIFSVFAGNGDKYNTSNNMSYKMNDWNFYGSYMLRSGIRLVNGYSNTVNTVGDSVYSIDQSTDARRGMLMHNFRTGFDYNLAQDQTISMEFNYRYMSPLRDSYNQNLISDTAFYHRINFSTKSNSDMNNNNYDLTARYKNQLDEAGQTLDASFTYSGFSNNETLGVDQNDYSDNFNNIISSQSYRTVTGGDYANYVGQVNYSIPFDDKTKIEAGFNTNIRTQKDEFNKDNLSSGEWIRDTSYYDKFDYKEFYHAFYMNFSSAIGDFSYQIGSRFEQANTELSQNILGKKYTQDYFSIYPSVYLSYNVSQTDKFQLSYTRRVDRPDVRDLNPFIDYSDPLNIRYGNPDLKPEYTNSYELGFLKDFAFVTILPEVFYKYTTDVITRYRVYNSDGTISNTQINLAESHTAGVDINTNFNFAKWARLNVDYSYFYYKINNQNHDPNINDVENYAWTAKATGFLVFSKDFNIQLSLNYTAPMDNGQSIRTERYFTEIGAKKDIIADLLTLNVRFTDVFNTMKFGALTYGNGYYIDTYHKPDSQTLFIGLTLKLDQNKQQGKKRDQNRNRNNNGDDNMDMDEGF